MLNWSVSSWLFAARVCIKSGCVTVTPRSNRLCWSGGGSGGRVSSCFPALYLFSGWNAMSFFHRGANPSREALLILNIGRQLPLFFSLFEHLQHKSCAWWNCSLCQWLSWEIMFAIYTSTRAWVMQLWQTCLLISAPSSWRKNTRGFVFSRPSVYSDDISGNKRFAWL